MLRRLTTLDRCDRCGAKATIAIEFSGAGELMFCHSHYEQHGERLMFSRALITGLDDFVDDGGME